MKLPQIKLPEKLVRLTQRFGKKSSSVALEEMGAPIFLMVGSLVDCTYKDAVAYARGLAESYVTSPAMGRIRVFEDKVAHRFIYEVREGGPDYSIIEGALESIAAGEPVRIKLAGGGVSVIEEPHGELYTLVLPARNESGIGAVLDMGQAVEEDFPVSKYCRAEKLSELYPENKKLINFGLGALSVAGCAFMLVGATYTVLHSDVFDADALVTLTKKGYLANANDNPVWQMEKAKNAAQQEGKSLVVFKKSAGRWSWELAKENEQ